MKTLIINSENEKDIQLLQLLAEKLGMKVMLLGNEEKEDIGLLKAMIEGSKGDYVSEEEVIKALRK